MTVVRALDLLKGAILVAVCAAAVLPLSARGENWGAGLSPTPTPSIKIMCTGWPAEQYWLSECGANTDVHYVYIAPPMHPQLKTALQNSIQQDYDDLPQVYAQEVTSPNSSTDVWVFYANEDPLLPKAYTYCAEFPQIGLNNVRYHMWCQPQYIAYQNNNGGNNCWNDGPCRRHYACHELGHTLGLQHTGSSASCMSYAASHPENLRPKDEEHLIDCYPHPTLPLPTYPNETRTDSCRYYGQ